MISGPVDSIAPRLFSLKQLPAAPDTYAYGIVINSSDNTLALPSNLGVPAHPAHPGDVVTIYALAWGPFRRRLALARPRPAARFSPTPSIR